MPMENLDLLYEITQALTAPGPLPRSLNQVLQILAQSVGMRRCTSTIVSPDPSELQIVRGSLLTNARTRRANSYVRSSKSYRPFPGVLDIWI